MGLNTVNENYSIPNMSAYVLTLSHLSRNSVAKAFWTTSTIKKLMKRLFIDNNNENKLSPIRRQVVLTAKTLKRFKQKLFRNHVKGSFENEKYTFYTEAYHQLDNTILPHVIKCQLRISIRVWGENVFNSLKDISRMISAMEGNNNILHMEDFIDNICLTNTGTVDVCATFRKIYSAEPQVVDYYMWLLACELCLEEYILLWSPNSQESKRSGKLAKMGRLIFEENHLQKYSDVHTHEKFWKAHRVFRYSYYGHFLMYWKLWKGPNRTVEDWLLFLAAIVRRTRIDFYDQWRIYDLQDSIEENMFRVSVVIGNFHAVQYFWNKLSYEAKSKSMRKMTAIACWYEWNIRYPFQCFALQCDKFLPKRTQFFDIVCFLIQNMPQSQLDELFSFPMGLRRLQQNVLKDFLPLVFLVNHEKYPEFCLNMARKSFEYVSSKPFTNRYLQIMQNLLEVLHHESELHGKDVFETFYEFWRLSPIDSKSQTRCYLQWYWIDYKKWHFDEVLDDIINHPDSPKFVQHYFIYRGICVRPREKGPLSNLVSEIFTFFFIDNSHFNQCSM